MSGRTSLLLAGLVLALAACGGKQERAGTFASLPMDYPYGPFQIWRSPEGDEYFRLGPRQLAGGSNSCLDCQGGPSQAMLVRGTSWFDPESQRVRHFRSRDALWTRMRQQEVAPSRVLVKAALARGKAAPRPAWAVDVEHSLERAVALQRAFGSAASGRLGGPVPYWLGRRVLGLPLTSVESGRCGARLVYRDALDAVSYAIISYRLRCTSASGRKPRLDRERRGRYLIVIKGGTIARRHALLRLVRPAPSTG